MPLLFTMINELIELLKIDSVTKINEGGYPYGISVHKALEYTLELCRKLGFRTYDKGTYAYAEIGEGKEIIGILGHLDVVEAGNGWDYPPYDGTIENGRLYGRGTIDDKGPMIAALFAVSQLKQDYEKQGKQLNKRIRFLFGQTEEVGEWTDMEAYCENEEPITYGFTPDGDFPALYCEKGVMVVNLLMPKEKSGIFSAQCGRAHNIVPDYAMIETNTGKHVALGKSAHGSMPEKGKNAITEVMKELLREENPFASIYMELIGEDLYGKQLGIDIHSKDSGPLTVNAGQLNTDEDKLRLTIDIRFPEFLTGTETFEKIKEKVKNYGLEAQLVIIQRPVYIDKTSAVIQSLLKAYREETGDLSEPKAIGGATYARAMNHIVAFGPNFEGQENREHEGNESYSLENYEKIQKIYRKAVENLLQL